MDFNKHDLVVLRRALAVARKETLKRMRSKKRRQESKRGNTRPGSIAELAMEAADYEQLFNKIVKEQA